MANINAQFNYSANFGPVIGQMQKLSAEANILNNTLQNLDKQAVGLKGSLASSFASDLGKIGGWNAKMVEMTDSVDNFGQSLLKQKLTLKEYAREAIGAFTTSSNAHKLAVREVARGMSQLVTLGKGMDGKQMGMMITPATINMKDFNTQLAVSRKQWAIFNNLVQDGTTHLINFGKNTQWAGRQITVGLTVPLTIYGNMVSKIFREVDAELTRFQKVYGADLSGTSEKTSNQMVNDVRNIAVEFSKSFGIAAKETASLAADLAATGLEGQKLLGALRETTRLAVLGDVSNQDAMKTTLSLQNAFKMSTDELAQSVNFLNAVENQTSLSLEDLTTAIPKAGPVIKALGGDVKDLSLLMVALKEGGISAGEGANAIKSGMASLINPTKQASLTAKQYGIDIESIVQANRGQLLPTIMEFQRQLQLLDDFGKAQLIEQIFGKYQFARMSALFDNLNANASQTNAVLGLMGKSNRELAATAYSEMNTLMNSASKRFERAVEGIKAQFLTIGQSITSSITPILEGLTGKIGKAIEFFQNLPKPVKSFIKVATGLTAVAGPIIMMVGIFSNFMGYVSKGAMGIFNLGRRMAGIPVEKFEMLTDTQLLAQKATHELANAFDSERSSVEKLNIALGLYKRNLADAISLNPAFINSQVAAIQNTAPASTVPTTTQLQKGGSAWVPGQGDGDKVPAMLEPGEYVVNKKAASQNSALLDDINFRQAPRFQMGGRMPGYADQSFIGPKPQISYNVQGTYMPGGYTPFSDYPFASIESAEAFQATNPRKWGGRSSRITRDINDPQQKAYADWIEGHNTNQFRTGTGVMKRMDMAGHREQMLNSMGPISQNIPLYRGTVLREKGANEFSGVGARELLMYIKHGMFDKAMGKKIQWSDMQSFSSNPNIASYNKFIESWTNPSNTNSKKAADRQLESMSMLPVVFRLANAKGQNGFNISSKAMVQEVMGKPVNEKEWVLNNPSGTISGIRQDIGTKNYIVDLMQNGGRVQSHADESFRAPFQKTDKEYETVYKWIGGELDYFRRRKNVKGRWTDSEKFDAERYQQLLSIMRSVPEGTRMMRGSLLNPGMSGEMSKESQLAMLTAIQTGDYGSLYGMDISFSDFASFASDFMGPAYGPRGMKGGVSRFSAAAYRKLYRGVHNRDTEKGRFFDDIERSRATGKESKYGSSPVIYDFTAGPNTQGRDISMGDPSTGAPYPKYRDSWVKEVPDEINEILTYGAQGTITGVSSDLQSRQPIIHMQGKQMGGRIKSAAGGMAFAHIVPPAKTPSGLGIQTLPFGLTIPSAMNRLLASSSVEKNSLLKSFASPIAEDKMSSLLGIYGEKDPQGTSESIRGSLISKLVNTKGPLSDEKIYQTSMRIPMLKNKYNEYLKSGKLYDVRSRISGEKLSSAGWALVEEKDGVKTFSKNGKKVYYGKRKGQSWNTVWGEDGKSLSTDTQTRSIGKNTPFDVGQKLSWLEKDVLGYQSGGRVNGYASETTSWAKKAAAPKAYAGVLQGIPSWATRDAEYQAIVEALRAAGIPESDRLASYYIQDVLAHINPSTTNANGVYEKVWAAANLMKDSQVYNVFLETLNSRKDIGGLLNPSTVSRVAAASGMSTSVVQAELTKMADGVHPNTANGARVMMTLARMFPSRTSPGMPIAVAAGMGARLQGDFYNTLGQRALPSNLPNITVRSYDPKNAGAPTSAGQGSKVSSSGIIMPSGAIRPSMVMPNIQSLRSNAGGTGSKATVKVDAMGNVLSNSIDDMVVNTVTGETIAVSSRELLAIGPNGGIAGVTSPGDEARGNIVHPVGTALMRGKKYQNQRLQNFEARTGRFAAYNESQRNKMVSTQDGMTEPVYDQPIARGGMDQFGGRMMMMVGAVDQMRFAMNQFTSETSNGTSKWVASMNLALTATQMLGQETGQRLMERGSQLSQGSGGPLSRGMGMAMSGLGKAANFLGNPIMQIGLQVAIMGVNKAIEQYQKQMAKAREAGNGAFKEPTEAAKLLGIELKSLTADTERYAKFAETAFGSQGRGAYDKAFAEAIKTDYADFLTILSEMQNKQEQMNQLVNVYGNLVQRGMDPKVALELTAEIARQGQAMSAFNEIQSSFSLKDTVGDVMKMQTDALESQIDLLNQRNEAASGNSDGAQALKKDALADFLGLSDSGIEGLLRKNISGEGFAGMFAKVLISEKSKEQVAAQIGATLKASFAIAAQDPIASNEAVDAIVANFKNADTEKINTEIGKIAEEVGYGDLSSIGLFIDTDSFTALGTESQTLFLNALKSGLAPELDKMLADGELSSEEESALKKKVLEAQALMKIDVEVDLQLDQTTKQLQAVQEEITKVFDISLRAKDAEIEAENKRHDNALKNLDKEAQRINDKKDLLQKNTEYYLKELEREKQAEDYYANQRQTSLQGLSAISQGDVFGFIGAQMKAASDSDQFGRDRSLAAIQETADKEQEKLDNALKAIDLRRQAEDARHQAELDNINKEIEELNKKKAATTGDLQEAIKLLEEAKALQPSSDPTDQKVYNEKIARASQLAGSAIDQAKAAAGFVDKTGLPEDLQKEMDTAQQKTGEALNNFYRDTDTAMQYIANGGEGGWELVLGGMSDATKKIFDGVAESLNIDAQSQEFIEAARFMGMAINSGTTVTPGGNRLDVDSSNPLLRASGGPVSGPGGPKDDSIPARLSNGEYVIQASAVKKFGTDTFDQLNNGEPISYFAEGGFVMPTRSGENRGNFGRKGPLWSLGYHTGLDFAGVEGTDILSVGGGIVESVNAHGGAYGNHIVIRHRKDLISLYAHLSKVLVGTGTQVSAGQHIGEMGSTGNSTGPHLHLEMGPGIYRNAGNPLSYLSGSGLVGGQEIAMQLAQTVQKNNQNQTKAYAPVVSSLQGMFGLGAVSSSPQAIAAAIDYGKNNYAAGGAVFGPGSATSDSIPAMLSNGEYVVNAASVKKYGVGTMNSINAGKFAGGGFVGGTAPSAPKYNVPSAGGGMDVQPIAQMARGGMMSGSASDNSSSYNFNFNGAGMDMVMSHVNKAVGGRISSNSRRIG